MRESGAAGLGVAGRPAPAPGRRLRSACLTVAALVAWAGGAPGAAAQTVTLAGRMGERALLVVDGRPQPLAVGQTVGGVRLLRWRGDAVEVLYDGRVQLLHPGATHAHAGASTRRDSAGEVALVAGPGGHFVTSGSIDGKTVRFMVDTGATVVALGLGDAERLGLDLAQAETALVQTANGKVAVRRVTLGRVRVGDLELTNVEAVVMPQAMPMVLLGNSFLSRLQMRRDNDVMRLTLR